MSASLVGSEMCIRDRMQSPRPLRPGRRLGLKRLRHRLLHRARHRSRQDCLLYTSDAADDM
eukprot:1071746-Alexandrium_andersonii.AAC.1